MTDFNFSVCSVNSSPCAVVGCPSTAYNTSIYCATHNTGTNPKTCEGNSCSKGAEVMGLKFKASTLPSFLCIGCAYESAIRSRQLRYESDESESSEDTEANLRRYANVLLNIDHSSCERDASADRVPS
jgi:hypothetical protein